MEKISKYTFINCQIHVVKSRGESVVVVYQYRDSFIEIPWPLLTLESWMLADIINEKQEIWSAKRESEEIVNYYLIFQ